MATVGLLSLNRTKRSVILLSQTPRLPPGVTKTVGIRQNLRIPIYWIIPASLNVNQWLTKNRIPD